MKRALLAFGIYLTCVSVVQARGPCYLDEQVPYRIPVTQGVIFLGLLDSECFGIYKDGVLVRYDKNQLFFGWMSSGAPGMATPITLPENGPHTIWKKARMHFSKQVFVYVRGKKVSAAMPYSWFFNGGHAIHEGKTLKRHASHGCVRLERWAAKALFYRFRQDELQVVIVRRKEDLSRWK